MPIQDTRSEIKVTVTQGHYALYNKRPNKESAQTMRAAINNELTTEPPSKNSQQPKPTCNLLIPIIILDSIGVNTQTVNLLTLDRQL